MMQLIIWILEHQAIRLFRLVDLGMFDILMSCWMIWDCYEMFIDNAETIEIPIRLTFPRVCFKHWWIYFLIIFVILIGIKRENKPLFNWISYNIVDVILNRDGILSRIFDEFEFNSIGETKVLHHSSSFTFLLLDMQVLCFRVCKHSGFITLNIIRVCTYY